MAGKHAQTLIEAASGVRDNGPAEVVTGPTGNRSGLSMHDGTASSLPTHRLSGWLISKWFGRLPKRSFRLRSAFGIAPVCWRQSAPVS